MTLREFLRYYGTLGGYLAAGAAVISIVATILLTTCGREKQEAVGQAAHDTEQNGAIAKALDWQRKHDAEVTGPGFARLGVVERKIDALTVWLRTVGRSQGWPEFPNPVTVPVQPDPGPGLYAAGASQRRGCP